MLAARTIGITLWIAGCALVAAAVAAKVIAAPVPHADRAAM